MGNTFSAKYFFDFITNFSNFSCDNIIQEYFLKCCYSDVSNLLSLVGILFLSGFIFPPTVDTIIHGTESSFSIKSDLHCQLTAG